MSMTRRVFLRQTAGTTIAITAGGGLVTTLSACGEEPGLSLPEGLAKPGTDLPEVSVKIGLPPNADELIPVIGVERGYYEDVGITLTPPPFGAKTDLLTSVTPLLNGQIEVGSAYPPTVLPQLDTVKNLKAFALMDVYYGYRILAPEGEYETVAGLMDQGQSFDEAAQTAMGQLQGTTFLRNEATSPTFFNIAFELGGLTEDDFDLVLLDNPGVVRAALAGRGDFAAPTGAVDIQALEQQGWEPIIEVRQLFENIPQESLPLRATNSGFLATADFINKNYETTLRLTSVMYRIIDDLERDPNETVGVFRDYVNSYTGNSLSVPELVELMSSLYSFRNFDDASDFFERENGDFYLPPAYDAQITDLEEGGTLKDDHDASDLILAGQVWEDLRRYRDEADQLLDGAAAEDEELAGRAREQYDARNYLDAYRFLASANSSGGT